MLLKAMLNRGPFDVAREMDRLFDTMVSSQPFGFVPAARGPWTFPPVNLWERPDALIAEAELPGMTMDDVEVLVTDGQLTVRGHREVDLPEQARPLRRERTVGHFERTLELPVTIDPERVEAKLASGVLSIVLPKAESQKPRKVNVKALPDAS